MMFVDASLKSADHDEWQESLLKECQEYTDNTKITWILTIKITTSFLTIIILNK